MRDKEYPHIGKSKVSDRYVLFISEGSGVCLNVKNARYHYAWIESTFKNITREYLSDTKIRIESPEHSEFVQRLALANGFSWCSGSVDVSHTDEKFIFLNSHGFIIYGDEDAYNERDREKEITIPIPAKESEVESTCEVSKSEIENHKRNEQDLRKLTKFMSQNGLGNAGDSAVDAAIVLLSASINDSKTDGSYDEWPQVGDEVVFCEEGAFSIDSEHKKLIVEEDLKFICSFKNIHGNKIAAVQDDSGACYAVLMEALSKPKSPQQKLRDELFECSKPKLDTLQAEDLANWLIDNYEIVKKEP